MKMKPKIYECRTCGNLVKQLFWGEGELWCCGAPLSPGDPADREGFRGLPDQPIDLTEVIIGGKSCWELSRAANGPC